MKEKAQCFFEQNILHLFVHSIVTENSTRVSHKVRLDQSESPRSALAWYSVLALNVLVRYKKAQEFKM